LKLFIGRERVQVNAIMELTRNLYRLEEVKASLIFCLVNGKKKTALFWCEEILASECGWILGEVLLKSWIWYACPYDVALIYDIRNADYDCDVDDCIIQIVLRLIAAIQKGERNVILTLTIVFRTHPTGGYTKKPATEQKKTVIHHILSDAGSRGLGDRMWYYLSRNLDFPNLKNLVRGSKQEKKILRLVVQTLVDLSAYEQFKLPALAACCLVISCRSDKRKIICKKSDVDDIPNYRLSIASWLLKQGKRNGRIFDIETVALHGLREQDSLQEIWDIYPALKDGTPFWKRIDSAYDLAEDSSRELFYDTWFPNDIPDEWSLDDQNKSHGNAALSLSCRKYSELYFRSFVKSKYFGLYLWLAEKQSNFLDFDSLYTNLKTMQPLYA
jgi:hypothetical protein